MAYTNTPDWLTINKPSLESPFGVYLWDIFDHFVSVGTNGWFIPSKFEFIHGELPFSTASTAISVIITYYLVIFGGRSVLNLVNAPPYRLGTLFQIHNAMLTTLSFTLLILLAEQLIPIIAKNGIYYGICHPDAWTQPIVTLYYLNYITKFIELLDTVFLVLKQKKLTFLHTYHHGATALLCYSQLVGRTSISWVVICLNLWVHVIMYFYYFLAARGIRVWWKEWVTRFQIIQFIIDIAFIYWACWQKLASEKYPWLPHTGACAGENYAAISGICIISSYLVLFIAFYINVYKRKVVRRKSISKGQPVLENDPLAKASATGFNAYVKTKGI